MRRFETAGRTGSAGAGTDAEFVQHEQYGLTFHGFKGNAGRIGQPVFHITIDNSVRNLGKQSLFQFIAQSGNLCPFLSHGRSGKFAGLAEADDIRNIFRPGTTSALLMSTAQKRTKTGALPDIKNADTLGAWMFMSGQCQKINRGFRQIDRFLTYSLYGIYMQQCAPFLDYAGNIVDGENRSVSLLAYMMDTSAVSLRMERASSSRLSLPLNHPQPSHFITAFFQQIAQRDNRRMFHARGNEMAFFRLRFHS